MQRKIQEYVLFFGILTFKSIKNCCLGFVLKTQHINLGNPFTFQSAYIIYHSA